MPISLLTGPANAGKAQVVMEALRAHAARGAEPLLVVPTDADQARYRRELVESGVASGARVERFQGLLSEVVRRAGRAEAALGELARERMLAAIAAAQLAGGQPVGQGLAGALAELIAELEARRVTPGRLRQAVQRAGIASAGRARVGSVEGAGVGSVEGARVGSVERICAVFEAYSDTLVGCGRADRELRVTRALDELRRRPARWGDTPVLLYGFDSFTHLQLDAIETLGRVVDAPVTVSLSYEPGRAAFVGRAHAFHRLRPLADRHTELAARADHYQSAARPALHHLERRLFEERAARVAPLGAVRLLEGSGPRSELQLLAAQVRALLDEGMPAEQIAIVHRSPERVLGLLAEALEDFDVPYCARVPIRFAHTAIGRALLGLMRCAVGEGGLGDLLAWLRAPGMLERPELADRLEADALRRGIADAAQARALWEAERWPLERIDRLCAAAQHGPHRLLDALGAELHRLFAGPRRRAAPVLGAQELPEARALAGALRALEQMRELVRCAPQLFGSPLELIGVLEGLEIAGRTPSSTGRVVVSDPLSLRARRVSALFLCGLQEGVFPAGAHPRALLGQEERRALAQDAGLLLDEDQDQLAAERYLLYALCSRPEQRLTLSWHASDHDGTPSAPSLFLDDVCDLFDEDLRRGVLRPELPNGAHGACEAQIQPLRDERVLGRLRERTVWSASSLEAWATCPVRWFVERLLRPEGLDADPEPLARGALAHAALRSTLERLRERTGSARITPASVGQAKRLLREALAEHGRERPLSLAPERLAGAELRLRAELERYLDQAAESPSPLEPAHLEIQFGFSTAGAGLPPLELGEGVQVRGRIDRVDVGSGGQAVVYDYKGRSAPAGARWAQDSAFQLAIYMGAVQSLLGHSAVGGFYQPLAGRDLRARGLLDADSGVALDCVRTDRRARADIDEILEQCRAAALAAVAQARAGRLEPRPASCSFNGGGCAYPEICRCEP